MISENDIDFTDNFLCRNQAHDLRSVRRRYHSSFTDIQKSENWTRLLSVVSVQAAAEANLMRTVRYQVFYIAANIFLRQVLIRPPSSLALTLFRDIHISTD